jgi:hypothetical protein
MQQEQIVSFRFSERHLHQSPCVFRPCCSILSTLPDGTLFIFCNNDSVRNFKIRVFLQMLNMPPAPLPESTKYFLCPFTCRKADSAVTCPVCSGHSDGHFRRFRRLWVEWGCNRHFLLHVCSPLSRSCMAGAIIDDTGSFCRVDHCQCSLATRTFVTVFTKVCCYSPLDASWIQQVSSCPVSPTFFSNQFYGNITMIHHTCSHSLFVIYPCSIVQNVKKQTFQRHNRFLPSGEWVGETHSWQDWKSCLHSQFNIFLLLCSQPACWSIYPLFVTDSKNIARTSSLWNWPIPLLLLPQFALSHTHLAVVFQNTLFVLLSRMDRASCPHVEEQLPQCQCISTSHDTFLPDGFDFTSC